MKLCVVSMSGGLDSTTLAYKAIEDGFTILPINIDYGQLNVIEKECFRNIYAEMKKTFEDKVLDFIEIDVNGIYNQGKFIYSSLRDSGIINKETSMEYYTPSRNLLFSVIAGVVGEITSFYTNADEIKIGLGVHKHSQYDRDYWDISPEFVRRLNNLLELNDCKSVELYTPFVDKYKKEIVEVGIELKVPWQKTWTCYNPIQEGNAYIYNPCLKCEACLERQKAAEGTPLENKINNYQFNIYDLRR